MRQGQGRSQGLFRPTELRLTKSRDHKGAGGIWREVGVWWGQKRGRGGERRWRGRLGHVFREPGLLLRLFPFP